MQLISDPSQLQPPGGKSCVAIGVFDGVHLGHQQVIRQAVADARHREARSVVITFDRHPNAVVAPTRVPPLIYSVSQKLGAIASLGVDVTWLIPFNEAFSHQTGEEFIRRVAQDFGQLQSVCVGSEFTFGHKRSGDVPLLEKLGRILGFDVHGLAAVSLDGDVVSSTRIRDAVRKGDFNAASQMLGRPYSLAGTILRGDQLGRKLGFPTANLDISGRLLPPFGVYAAHARVADGEHRAVVNLGVRPTVPGQSETRAEVHLLNFARDIYGSELEVTFVQKLRDEQRFPSLEALTAQIGRDIVAARAVFGA